MKNFKNIKGNLYIIENGITNEKIKIIFRLINFNNMYYFAEEISTGCIFPIFNCVDTKEDESKLKTFSYLKEGKNFVFYPLVGSNSPFKYKLDRLDRDFKSLKSVNSREINEYLNEKEEDMDWITMLYDLEAQNEFMCDINLIKEKIATLHSNNDVVILEELENLNPKYEEHIDNIDLKEISNFGYNLSEQRDLCNLIGREEEIKRIIKTTCISGKSVLLIGESGCGKTSIVEKLALDIKNKKNEWLKGKTIFYLNLSAVLSGTHFRGAFEKNLEKIINFCKKNQGRIILFIDEIHSLYGLGRTEDSAMNGMDMLKPYISNGTITIIGATTKDEYEKHLTNDPAFLRRFQKIDISLPDEEMNIKIILSYIKKLEEKYNIKLNLSELQKQLIVQYIINVTNTKNQKVIGDIKVTNPTISKNVMEDAFLEALYNEKEFVSINDICIAIISCDKLSPSFRKEKATQLKEKINNSLEEKGTIIKMPYVK
ncbi:MAG: ATP-dependent Clp protease ATP-binding subunit [Bacilli bacterium]|nr:ATP-dependent Clp protease ATP-binding subunit [Bacilli bacterium]